MRVKDSRTLIGKGAPMNGFGKALVLTAAVIGLTLVALSCNPANPPPTVSPTPLPTLAPPPTATPTPVPPSPTPTPTPTRVSPSPIPTTTPTASGPPATTTPRLISVYFFEPSTAVPGSTITAVPDSTISLVYMIYNPRAPNQPIEPRSVALSASIKGPSGTLSDPANDRTVVLLGGETALNVLLFRIPPSTQPGRYDVIFTITVDGAPADTRVCDRCLTIVPTLVTPTATPSPRATVNVTIEPAAPKVGDTVRVTASASGPGGIPQYTLHIEPVESPALTLPTNAPESRIRRESMLSTPVTWELKAVRAGAVTLTVGMNYETSEERDGRRVFFFTSATSGPLSVTVTERTATPTPIPDIDRSTCYYSWATEGLPQLSTLIQSRLQAAGVTATDASAYAFGENNNCRDRASGKTVSQFLAMETDFSIRVQASDLADLDTLGDVVARVIRVVAALPADLMQGGPNSGKVTITFATGQRTTRLEFFRRAGEEALARGASGAALLQALGYRP